MAIASGNSRKANELLRQAGYRAPDHTTLNRWATRIHQERYRELQREMRDELNARRADTHEALSQAYGDMEWEILERLRDKLPEMKGGELATAANKFSIASAVHTDKARIYRDEPTEIVQRQDPIEALRKLQALGVVKVAPGAASRAEARSWRERKRATPSEVGKETTRASHPRSVAARCQDPQGNPCPWPRHGPRVSPQNSAMATLLANVANRAGLSTTPQTFGGIGDRQPPNFRPRGGQGVIGGLGVGPVG